MNNYSDLVIVGYPGGFGGDYFTSIINRNYNKNFTPIKRRNFSIHDKNLTNQYLYTASNTIPLFKSIQTILCLFCKHIRYEHLTEIEKATLSLNFNQHIDNAFKILFDETPKIILDNYNNFLVSNFNGLKYKPHVINTHYCSDPPICFKNFSLNNIFPGSIKLRLVCESKYIDMFRVLNYFKTNQIIIENIDDVTKFKKSDKSYESFLPIDDLTTKERFDIFKNNHDNFYDIDVGKLYFEDDSNVDIIETRLSEILNKKIYLNKAHICNEYKVKNDKILRLVLGNNYTKNSIDTNLELFLQHARNRKQEYIKQL